MNKNSIHDRGPSKGESLNDLQRLNSQSINQHQLRDHGDAANVSKEESFSHVNETFIVNENPNNDDYVKKICSILNENLINPRGKSKEGSLVLPVSPSKVKGRVQPVSRPVDLNTSKIFQLVRSQEQKRNAEKDSTRKRDAVSHYRRLFDSAEKQDCDSVKISMEFVKENINPNSTFHSPTQKHGYSAKRAPRRPLSQLNSTQPLFDSRASISRAQNNVNACISQGRKNPSFAKRDLEPRYMPLNFSEYMTSDSAQQKEVIIEALEEMGSVDEVEPDVPGISLHQMPRKSADIKKMRTRKCASHSEDLTRTAYFRNGLFAPSLHNHESFKPDGDRSYTDQDSSKVHFRQCIAEAKHPHTPMHCERLYTVEEVCSPSKEGSTGGDTHFKSFNSRSANKNYTNNYTNTSIRMKTSEVAVLSSNVPDPTL